MENLYPLKFTPIYKTNIWGGSRFFKDLNRQDAPKTSCGESWEISGVADNISVISNGFLKGNTLEEAIEIYMDDLVGLPIYEKYGVEFPILCKLIDSNDMLSVQVHPDDELAKERHNAYGKNEMWYVVDCEKDAELVLGFNTGITRDSFLEAVMSQQLHSKLNTQKVASGEVYYIPAGTVHAIGKGLLIAEIQQTSDITYRIHDWNRVDSEGKSRELHLDLSLDAIDFDSKPPVNITAQKADTGTSKLVDSEYFKTNIIETSSAIEKDYYLIDSFIIYMCLEGKAEIEYGSSETVSITQGESILIPASLNEITITPSGRVKVLETYL